MNAELKMQKAEPSTLNSQPSTKFLVRMKGGYALKFHRNHCGNMYEAVADSEATTFTNEDDAITRACSHGLRLGFFTVDPL